MMVQRLNALGMRITHETQQGEVQGLLYQHGSPEMVQHNCMDFMVNLDRMTHMDSTDRTDQMDYMDCIWFRISTDCTDRMAHMDSMDRIDQMDYMDRMEVKVNMVCMDLMVHTHMDPTAHMDHLDRTVFLARMDH